MKKNPLTSFTNNAQCIHYTLKYASSAWYSTLSKASTTKLQASHTLRTILGYLVTWKTHHLYNETKILSVQPHLYMLCTQFYAAAPDLSNQTILLQTTNSPVEIKYPSIAYFINLYSLIPLPLTNTILTKHIDLHNLTCTKQLTSKLQPIVPRQTWITISHLHSGADWWALEVLLDSTCLRLHCKWNVASGEAASSFFCQSRVVLSSNFLT